MTGFYTKMTIFFILELIYFACEPGLLSPYSDLLRDGRSGDRIPVGARFFSPVQTGPLAHTSSYTRVYRVSFPGVKRPGRGVNHPPSSRAEVKERTELYLYGLSGPSWPLLGSSLPVLCETRAIL